MSHSDLVLSAQVAHTFVLYISRLIYLAATELVGTKRGVHARALIVNFVGYNAESLQLLLV